jgi:glutathione peroxidase
LFSSNIKWNFTNFLIDRKENVIKRYGPTEKPEKMIKEIEKLLNENE